MPPKTVFDEILPISISLTDDNYRWFAFGVRTHTMFALRFVRRDDIVEIYERNRRLKDFAAYFGLNFKRAKSLLEHNGIDFTAQLQEEYLSGMSLRKLSQTHGPKQETISGWLKMAGTPLRNGNERLVDRELLKKVLSETCSVKKAADTAGIHWKTAKRHLDADS